MTETEIVLVLAGRLNWTVHQDGKSGRIATRDENWEFNCHFNPPESHPLVVSIDALRPVLEQLTPEEWGQLCSLVEWQFYQTASRTSGHYTLRAILKFTFTLPPATLARLMAEAIVQCRPNLASSEADRPKEGTTL